MFEHPPAFTHAIANLTAWFDWNALSAIGTVGAFWFLVLEQTRTTRADRLSRFGTLAAVASLLDPIVRDLPMLPDPEGNAIGSTEKAQIEKVIPLVERAIFRIDQIQLTDLAAVGLLEYRYDLEEVLADLLASMRQSVASGLYCDYAENAALVGQVYHFIAVQQSRMESYFKQLLDWIDLDRLVTKEQAFPPWVSKADK